MTERTLRNFSPRASEIDQAIKNIPGLEETGLAIARRIHEYVLNGGDQTRTIADILHGTWLGHPLHPALVTVPIGAWTSASLFDLFAVLGGGAFAERAADALITIGVIAAVPTAMAGMADYSAIKEDAAATGAMHALLNSASLGLYLLSLKSRASGQRPQGVLFSTLALALVTASAGIAGNMVYRQRVGVSHMPEDAGPSEWTAVCAQADLLPHTPKRVEVKDTPVLLYRDGESLYAIAAVCSHAGGPLEDGEFDGHCVQCPWHQSVFDLRDGSVVHGPATQGQPAFEVRTQYGQVEIRRQIRQ
jgi:nitrite reductase/ring-hydroxylating ferredoxin subunit/uncharacterized membrane protein